MRFLRHSLTGLFLMAVTLGLIVYAGSVLRDAVVARMTEEPRMPQARERVFAVNLVTATPETITPVLTAFGEIRSRRTLEIRAATTGTVVDLAEDFEDGAVVTRGQVLARIDPANAQSAFDRAGNDLRDAEVAARDAERAVAIARDTLAAAEEQAALQQRAYERQVDLRDRGVGSASAVESAELSVAASRQSVLSARNALAQAETRVETAANALTRSRIAQDEAQRDLDDTTIRAEFDGTLTGTTAVQGGLVSANEQLAQLVDAGALEVAFRVSTTQYARLLNDQGRLLQAPVRVTLDVQGIALTADGTITRDSAAVEQGQTGRRIFARLDTSRGLKPGDFVTVSITEPPLQDVVRLPATALDAAGTVLAITGEERLEPLQVSLLRRQGDDVLVRGKTLAGREIVAQRSPLLGAGIKVRPLRSEPPPRTEEPAETALVELTPERREKLKEFITSNDRLPDDIKTRILAQLDADRVPAAMIRRIESRMGG
ncbi:efflux transporter, RND family, MFP subunit [Pseudooceanicola batsensis HTCC2597]|uniref:Efflux transporter, RND family, MFP subunit n=1 Tax=Pseudooceanicola batsensis (strain ATCC BAA-863 / DSM 15984 / KCTC 12145 / HTCC2597) TaxID=252305 RepID=A3TV91_PSEBH|nr:HlyD family efflux transporter periplasmic adaptor subunit [Pseudooceanicola batsensis]EAQ04437.1 efflux transporter, RND family, MFP subunit [Pseudooceanicola batsensis HTCC2597]